MTKSWVKSEVEKGEKKPRLLLVDDREDHLLAFASEMEKLGFEVVKVKIQGDNKPSENPEITSFLWVDDVAKFALNSANRIDAVLTDMCITNDDGRKGLVPYAFGPHQIDALVESGFNGPIAAHSSDPGRFYRLHANRENEGIIGVFDKDTPGKTAEALHQAIRERGRGTGAAG